MVGLDLMNTSGLSPEQMVSSDGNKGLTAYGISTSVDELNIRRNWDSIRCLGRCAT